MWEFSIKTDSSRFAMAKYIYKTLQPNIEEVKGVITSFEQGGKISVCIACDELEKSQIGFKIMDVISFVICTFMKEEFLTKRLKLPKRNNFELFTFKKAIVNFDRETDRFIVNKYLSLEKDVFIESFFHFKLNALKEKWIELVAIANDNNTYLLSDDCFIELVKFLIENIEISTDEVSVIIRKNKMALLDANNKNLLTKGKTDFFNLVSGLLELSPRKINWYSDEKNSFLEKIFEKRILFVQEDEKFLNLVDNGFEMV